MKSKKPFDHYKEHICKIWFDEKGYQTATEIVSGLIRCKDCKYYKVYELKGYTLPLCNRIKTTMADSIEEDDYCSKAERKEG